MSDEPKVVHIIRPSTTRTDEVEHRNDLMKTAETIARCCGMAPLEYERGRTKAAKELKVRPAFIDRKRKVAWDYFDYEYRWRQFNWERKNDSLPGDSIGVNDAPRPVAFVVFGFYDEEGNAHHLVIYPDEELSFGTTWRKKSDSP